jgi:hypothetical protein
VPGAAAASSTNPARSPAAAKEAGAKSGPRPAVATKKTGPLPTTPKKAEPHAAAAQEASAKADPGSAEPAEPAPSPEESVKMYSFVQEAPPPPKPKKRKQKDEEDDDGMMAQGVGFDKEYLRKRKLQKKKAVAGRVIPSMSNLTLIVLVSIVIWLALGGLMFVNSKIGLVLFAFGALMYAAGSIWLIIEAFLQSVLWGVLCLFFLPALVFICMYWERAGRPFGLAFLGGLMMGSWPLIVFIQHQIAAAGVAG